jgi:phosphoribosylformylglycinamidine synthase
MVLGGPAMLIGLGGGAASSMTSGSSAEDLDFASVQRANPEMERRCQEVIDRCWARGEDNPILFIHDVGAGGLSNALPELVHDGGAAAASSCARCRTTIPACRRWRSGATSRRNAMCWPSRRSGSMRPSRPSARASAAPMRWSARRPRRKHSGSVTATSATWPIDMPLPLLFGKPPKMLRDVQRIDRFHENGPFDDRSWH